MQVSLELAEVSQHVHAESNQAVVQQDAGGSETEAGQEAQVDVTYPNQLTGWDIFHGGPKGVDPIGDDNHLNAGMDNLWK